MCLGFRAITRQLRGKETSTPSLLQVPRRDLGHRTWHHPLSFRIGMIPKTYSGTTPLTTNLIWEVLLALG